MKTTSCRGCGRPIGFIRSSTAEKWIPVDPALVSGSDIEIHAAICAGKRVTVITDDGRVLRIGKADRITQGYIPHWATCPKASEFRQEKSTA